MMYLHRNISAVVSNLPPSRRRFLPATKEGNAFSVGFALEELFRGRQRFFFFLQEIMTDTCSKHKDADQLFSFGSTAVESGVLTNEQVDDVRDRMSDLKVRWNVLNIDVIEREKRLVTFFFLIFRLIC